MAAGEQRAAEKNALALHAAIKAVRADLSALQARQARLESLVATQQGDIQQLRAILAGQMGTGATSR